MISVSGLQKTAIAAFTDERVVIKIRRKRSTDRFTIRYPRIHTVAFDVDDFLSGPYIQGTLVIATSGESYRITISQKMETENVRDVVEWVDEKAMKETQGVPTDAETSVQDRLNELQTLHDENLITEEEFQRKREEILDDL